MADMSRLTPLTRDAADPEQQEVWDSIVDSRGGALRLVGPEGGLVGPFNAMVTSPGMGARMAELGGAVRFANRLDPKLKELAICTAGVRWKAEFEWWAHRRLGIEAGLSESVLDAMADGGEPSFEAEGHADGDAEDQAAVYAFARQLVENGRVDDETYRRAVERLGEPSVVDLVITVGYYSLVCFTLNAFEVPLPDGVEQVWPD